MDPNTLVKLTSYDMLPEWQIAKRRNNRVRFRNTETGKWDGWLELPPTHPEFVGPKPKARTEPVASPTQEVTVTYRGHEEADLPAPDVTDMPPAYESMSRDNLRKLATEHKIAGRGTMTKQELIAALRELS